MTKQQISYRYITTQNGDLYKGTFVSGAADDICVWDCFSLGGNKHVGFVAQSKNGLTSLLCSSCDEARVQMAAILGKNVVQKQK